MQRAFLVALSLAIGCSSSSTKGNPESCTEAAAEVSNALAESQRCGPDAGCTLVEPPTCVSSSAGSSSVPDNAAVANGSLATVEHAFSVIEAEMCSQCDTNGGGRVSFDGVAPTAVCSQGICTVVTQIPPPESQGPGSFEWDCDAGCDSEAYCEVDVPGVWASCPGWPDYGTVIGPGHCVGVGPTQPDTACYNTAFCGFQQNCTSDGGVIGVCVSTCPESGSLSNCEGDCQLQPDNHGCIVCACLTNGCPPPPPDGGL